MKIAALQLNAEFADVKANLNKIEKHIASASEQGARLVLLPEFFTSAIGFFDKMLNVALDDKGVHNQLVLWAEKYNIIIGGSYIAVEGEDAYNLFELVFPNGETYRHKKDIPTQFEGCYYTNGDEDNVLHTPIGNIGVALCWEMIRYDTVRRIAGKVDFVLAGSCWWDLPEDAPAEREPLRKYNQSLALNTPVEFARLIGVPVIHANHCGKVTAYNFPNGDTLQIRQLVGAAQIISGNGEVLARRSFDAGEGIVVAEVIRTHYTPKPIPNRYWIPNLPESYIRAWETANPKAREYYEEKTAPLYRRKENKKE